MTGVACREGCGGVLPLSYCSYDTEIFISSSHLIMKPSATLKKQSDLIRDQRIQINTLRDIE
jgi:hypothetical protein